MATVKRDIREIRFARHYLSDPELNGTRAAILAGYAESRASNTAGELLKKDSVRALLRKFAEYSERRAGISRARILNELGRLGFSNMQDYIDVDAGGRIKIDLSSMTRDESAAIQELTFDETVEGEGKDKKTTTRTKLKLANKRES